MVNENKVLILKAAKEWFVSTLVKNHIINTKKLVDPREFNINPFLINYLANFLCGDNSPKSIARALVFPRILGSSINTSFGQNIQKFTSEVLNSFGSAISGIDLEFIDSNDGRKKYCQIKAGPNTINKDDVDTIHRHFDSLRNIARTNNLDVNLNDLVVGVLYGDNNDISSHYEKLESTHNYNIIVGADFWAKLTNDSDFYFDLIKVFSEAATTFNGSELIESTINELADTDEIKALSISN